MITVAVWPDSEWCYEPEIQAYMRAPCARSDDYELHVFPDDSTEDYIDYCVVSFLALSMRGKP